MSDETQSGETPAANAAFKRLAAARERRSALLNDPAATPRQRVEAELSLLNALDDCLDSGAAVAGAVALLSTEAPL